MHMFCDFSTVRSYFIQPVAALGTLGAMHLLQLSTLLPSESAVVTFAGTTFALARPSAVCVRKTGDVCIIEGLLTGPPFKESR